VAGSYTWSLEVYNVTTGVVDDTKSITISVSAWADIMNLLIQLLPLLIFMLVIMMLVSAFRSKD